MFRLSGACVMLAVVVAMVGAITPPAASAGRTPATAAADVAVAVVQDRPTVAGAVVSVTPARIADSRSGLQIRGAVPAAGTVAAQVTGKGGIPPKGAAAVIATVTVITPATSGSLTIWPAGSARTRTSNLSFGARQDIASTVVVPVGTGGRIQLLNRSAGAVHLVIDVDGYTRSGTATAVGTVTTVRPARIADSRTGQQIRGAIRGRAAATVQVVGEGGIPAEGVAAVIATVTAITPAAGGSLTIWPAGAARAKASNLSFSARRSIANTVIVPVGTRGKIQLYNTSAAAVQLVVDVAGYTRSGTPTAAGTVQAVPLSRIADSRRRLQIAGAIPAGATATVQVTGQGGIPRGGASMVVVGVTAVAPRTSGYVTGLPSGAARTHTSNLNFRVGQTIANTAIVRVGTAGRIRLFNRSAGAVHLLVDVMGYTRTSTQAPGFRSSIRGIDAGLAARMATSWRPGCPVPLSGLRLVRLTYRGFDGADHMGGLVVAAAVAPGVVQAFHELYGARYPLNSLRLVADFGGSDDRSKAADNSSAFNCRRVTGGTGFSQHSYGTAIDLNPVQNPYVSGDVVLPQQGRAFLARTPAPGVILARGAVVTAFARIGWTWGGSWRSPKDYQHFSANGR